MAFLSNAILLYSGPGDDRIASTALTLGFVAFPVAEPVSTQAGNALLVSTGPDRASLCHHR